MVSTTRDLGPSPGWVVSTTRDLRPPGTCVHARPESGVFDTITTITRNTLFRRTRNADDIMTQHGTSVNIVAIVNVRSVLLDDTPCRVRTMRQAWPGFTRCSSDICIAGHSRQRRTDRRSKGAAAVPPTAVPCAQDRRPDNAESVELPYASGS